jgi:hypothetical protein
MLLLVVRPLTPHKISASDLYRKVLRVDMGGIVGIMLGLVVSENVRIIIFQIEISKEQSSKRSMVGKMRGHFTEHKSHHVKDYGRLD